MGALRASTMRSGEMNRVHILQKVLERGVVRECPTCFNSISSRWREAPPILRIQLIKDRAYPGVICYKNKAFGISISSASQTSCYYLITPQFSHHCFHGNRQRNSSLPNSFCSSSSGLFFSIESKLAGKRTRLIFTTGTRHSLKSTTGFGTRSIEKL